MQELRAILYSECIKNNIQLNDAAILVKASRGMRLEEIVKFIKELKK